MTTAKLQSHIAELEQNACNIKRGPDETNRRLGKPLHPVDQ